MTDPALLAYVNKIIERLFALDEEIANGRALRALLQDLHERDLFVVKEPHASTITMVRAGILRAFISSVLACLDRSDSRGNRASVGQILSMLDADAQVVAVFRTKSGKAALERAKREYEDLLKDDLFEHARNLRNAAIAHLLIKSAESPETTYDTVYALHDAAEQLTISLYEVCDRGKPRFLNDQKDLIANAKIFWDTYFDGMRRT